MGHDASYVDDPNDEGIYFEIIGVTADAVLLSDGAIQDWCPRSQMREGNLIGYEHIGKELELHLAEWIVEEKGWS